jgi:hypothetical protein
VFDTEAFAVAVNVTALAVFGLLLLGARLTVHWLVHDTDVDADACTFDGGIDVED